MNVERLRNNLSLSICEATKINYRLWASWPEASADVRDGCDYKPRVQPTVMR
jgi:hypothetical protein